MSRRYTPVPLKNVNMNDPFWSSYDQLVRDVVIPYQWDALNDAIEGAEPSHAIRNFRIAAGLEEGRFGGFVFQDSDLAKWLEAVAYSLTKHPDPALEQIADEAIELIAQAQQEDGYINTFFTIEAPDKRWTNLTECHELYVAGHLIEAAVAYEAATGKRRFLDVMCQFADYIDSVFGKEEGKLRGYDGHQEIELALVKLYHATGNERYLQLSQYFIDERGQEPSYLLQEWEKRGKTTHWNAAAQGDSTRPNLAYFQSEAPVREQKDAHGHAVRAVYMYTAMADLAAQTGDESLLEACRRLWKEMIRTQMYITGGIGSTHLGEAFTFSYDLPNDNNYAETCASIGLIFFAHRMLQIEANSEYADVIERAVYNTVISSMSQDGKHYFYVNPLEVWPEACERNPGKQHVKPVRQKWFGCSCCPPNVARLIASLGEYIYSVGSSSLYVHQYIGGEAEALVDDKQVKLTQKNDYPWDGEITIQVNPSEAHTFTLGLRIPGWCHHAKLFINNEEVSLSDQVVNGYACINRLWEQGDEVKLLLEMEIQLIQSHPLVRANSGKLAVTRGPLVYCIEEADHDTALSSILLPKDINLSARLEQTDSGQAVHLHGEALAEQIEDWGDELYRPVKESYKPIPLVAVPYYTWGNRGQGEMRVWLPTKG